MGRQTAIPGPRGQGHRAGLDLEQVIAAARSLGARNLTMQAVADHLGVDRKTVNHHVRDRDSLLRLAAGAAFRDAAPGTAMAAAANWQDATVILATTLVDCVVAAGEFAEHLRLDADVVDGLVGLTEQLARHMDRAGFSAEETVRSLAHVCDLCLSHARDVIASERASAVRLREALAAQDPALYPHLHRIMASSVNTGDRAQFDLTIETFIRGTEARHAQRRASR